MTASCAVCVRSGNCSLQQLANDMGCIGNPYGEKPETSGWNMDFPLIRDNAKCIKCMRCIQICDKVQNLGVWDVMGTGQPHDRQRRPTDARLRRRIARCAASASRIARWRRFVSATIRTRYSTALHNPDTVTVVQVAPAVRAAWGEQFGLPPEVRDGKAAGDAFCVIWAWNMCLTPISRPT